jgi:hypothetical protein
MNPIIVEARIIDGVFALFCRCTADRLLRKQGIWCARLRAIATTKSAGSELRAALLYLDGLTSPPGNRPVSWRLYRLATISMLLIYLDTSPSPWHQSVTADPAAGRKSINCMSRLRRCWLMLLLLLLLRRRRQ